MRRSAGKSGGLIVKKQEGVMKKEKMADKKKKEGDENELSGREEGKEDMLTKLKARYGG